jgi:hypothetical protein
MAALEPYGDFIRELFDTGKTHDAISTALKQSGAPKCSVMLCGAQPSKKKSSIRFSFRSSTRRLSRRLPRKTIKLAIVECERLDGTFETSLYVVFFNPECKEKVTALFPAFIAVLSKYHANKTSNWIIQFSRFDLKNIPFALFRLQNQIRKTKKRLC